MSQGKNTNLNDFDLEGAIYLEGQRDPNGCKVGIFGVPYDGTTSFRPGARFGPAAIREFSTGLESYCPHLKIDLNDIHFADLGSLNIPFGAPEPVISLVKKATQKLLELEIKPLILGGEHSITCGSIAALARKHQDLVLIQLDAHADLREEWLGNRYNHACAMRRCLDVLPNGDLLQLGIRSGTRTEFEEMRSQKRLIKLVSGEAKQSIERALTPFLGRPIYLTVDLDWFDPSVIPGTGTPEPGGFFWQDFAAVIEVLLKHEVIGADVVELSPQLDPSGASSIFASKVTRSLLMLLNGEV